MIPVHSCFQKTWLNPRNELSAAYIDYFKNRRLHCDKLHGLNMLSEPSLKGVKSIISLFVRICALNPKHRPQTEKVFSSIQLNKYDPFFYLAEQVKQI